MWQSLVFENAPIGLARVGLDGRWLNVNAQVCRLLDRPREDIEKLRFHDVTHPEDLDHDVAQAERLLACGKGSYSVRKRYVRPAGSVVWVDLTVSLSCDTKGNPAYFVSSLTDASAEQRTLERLKYRVRHDPLTNLLNRDGFSEELEDRLANTLRGGAGFTLFYVDLDGFKLVNDGLGHATGDALLRQVAQRLEAFAHQNEPVARIGGDEFALILPDQENRTALRNAVTRLGQKFRHPFQINGHRLSIRASIGTANCPSDAQSICALLDHADQDMYSNKRKRAENAAPQLDLIAAKAQ